MPISRGASCSATDILSGLNKTYYKGLRETWMRKILKALEKKKSRDDIAITISNNLPGFFDRNKATAPAILIKEYPKIEPMLYALENSYRDHYIHMFNVYLSGSRIISQIISLGGNEEKSIEDDFKLTEEVFTGPLGKKPSPWQPYSAIDRIFYVWLLISTFHDLGIVVEKIDKIRDSLNEFLKNFGVQLDPFSVIYRPIVNTKVDTYFKMMARFYGIKIPTPIGCEYNIVNENDEYLRLSLLKALEEQDHGVISSITLLKVIQESFSFQATDEKYDLTIEKFHDYCESVLKNDISRAAMVIALHNLDPIKYKRLFPIDFQQNPLTFLLVLCDELEEYRRWFGTSIRPIEKLTRFPIINIKKIRNKYKLTYQMYYQKIPITNEKLAVREFNKRLLKEGKKPIKKFSEIIKRNWNFTINKRLKSKLILNKKSKLKLKITVYYDGRILINREIKTD